MTSNRYHMRRRRRTPVGAPTGMTLLEVMLALTLTAFVLAAISMAIDLNLRMLDKRRGDVERIQVARAILQLIAKDLRSAVRPSEIDFSSLASMAADAALSGGLPAGLGDTGDTGGDASGGSGGDTGGSSGRAPGGSPGGAPGGVTPGDLEDALDDVLSGNLGGAGDSSAGGSVAGDLGGDITGDLGDTGTVANTDIAASESPAPVPGLYGNQFELQIDVGRLPRVDEMQRMVTASSTGTLQDIPSDVKTVAYFLYDPANGTGVGDYRDAAGNPQAGLVRRVLDRAVTLYASDNASSSSLQNAGEVIAAEIVMLQFEYFDGMEWLSEWDSQEQGGLPMAVRITIVLAPRDNTQPTGSRTPVATSQVGTDINGEMYSLTVRLPAAQRAESATTDPSGMEAVGL